MIIPPLRLALAGGGIKVLAEIGALQELERRGYLKTVREIVGISAGGLIATAYCVGYTTAQMEDVCTRLNFEVFQNLEPESILQMGDTFGIDNGQNLRAGISAILKVAGLPPDITFAQLADARPKAPRLRLFATDLNLCAEKEYSLAKTPNVEVRLALQASMSIPIYYAPVVDPETGHHMADGGVVFTEPYGVMTHEDIQHSLLIAFDDKGRERTTPITSFGECVGQVYYTAYYQRIRELRKLYGHQTILVRFGSITAVDFGLSTEEKKKLILLGRLDAEEFLDTFPRLQPPARRFSV
jgi:NTE family protein